MSRLSNGAIALALSVFCTVCGCGDDDALGADAGGPTDAGPPRWEMPPCDRSAGPFAPLSTRCQHLVDADGRVALLRGVNARVAGVFDVTFDDGRAPLEPIPALTIDDTRRMRALGFDVLRLPIHWSGIEPDDASPPAYDDAYLDRVAAAVDLCRMAGLWVLLDFHQDAYSKEIGEDGAPLWAIQPPPDMLLGGPLEDLDARRRSAQVLRAFNTFFGDAEPGPTLRARFYAMAAHVAARFRGDDTVIGYELYNEPIAPGDRELDRFHDEATVAIRAADAAHLVFFEPLVIERQFLDRSTVPAAPFAHAGGVYAPHIYTLAFTGTEAQRRAFTRSTLRPAWVSAGTEAAAWGTPLFVTEWGYGPSATRAEDYVAAELDLADELGASTTFWVWKEQSQGSWGLFDHDAATDMWTERPALRRVLSRPRAAAVAGWPTDVRYDASALRLEVRYEGSASVTAPTELYVPAPEDWASSWGVTCDGALVTTTRDPATGLVPIPCNGPGPHAIVLSVPTR